MYLSKVVRDGHDEINFSSKGWHLFCPVPSSDPGTGTNDDVCPVSRDKNFAVLSKGLLGYNENSFA